MATEPITVRIFGSLRPEIEGRGLGNTFTMEVPEQGISARDLAVSLGLDLKLIEGVFVNHVVHGLAAVVRPGDRVAFLPHDTPGPHRFFLGIWKAGRDENA